MRQRDDPADRPPPARGTRAPVTAEVDFLLGVEIRDVGPAPRAGLRLGRHSGARLYLPRRTARGLVWSRGGASLGALDPAAAARARSRRGRSRRSGGRLRAAPVLAAPLSAPLERRRAAHDRGRLHAA